MTVIQELFELLGQTWFLHEKLLWPKYLTYWPKTSSGHLLTCDHDKPSYQVPRLSLKNFSRYWADMVFALNGTVTFTFDLVTSKFIGSSTNHDQSSYQVPWLSLINFSRYWVDMVFALNGTVTLTFDLVTSKFIGVIYWPWPIFLPSIMTVTHKLFKILSGHGFCIKWYCDLDLWPSDLKIYRGHLLNMTNLPTMYHDCHS